jgi:hypothetical protein
MSDQEISISIVLPKEAEESVSTQIKVHGLQGNKVKKPGIVDPITITVIVIGSVFALAKLIKWITEENEGGTFIDLTKDPPIFRTEKALDVGVYVIVTKTTDGEKISIETKDVPADSLDIFLRDILKVGKEATVDIVKEVIKGLKEGASNTDKEETATI